MDRRPREPIRRRAALRLASALPSLVVPILLGPKRLERLIARAALTSIEWDSSSAHDIAVRLTREATREWRRPAAASRTTRRDRRRARRWTEFVRSAIAAHDWRTFGVAVADGSLDLAREILVGSEQVNTEGDIELAARWLACGIDEHAAARVERWGSRHPDAIGLITDLVPAAKLPTTWVMEAGEVELALPEVWQRRPARAVTRRLVVPPLGVHHVERARLVRGTAVLDEASLVIYDESARPSSGFVAGEWAYIAGWPTVHDRAIVHATCTGERFVDEAVLLSGRCDFNHFHMFFEYLPRIGIVDRVRALDRVPLLITDEVSEAAKSALRHLAGTREIIEVSRDEVVHVALLHVPSMHTYHPDSTIVPWIDGAGYSPTLLQELRDRLLPLAATRQGLGERIYLTRGAGARGLLNADQVAEMLADQGFRAVDAAALDLEDQIAVFRDADFVVAVGGAGLTNMLFGTPGTQVIAMVAEQLGDYATHPVIAQFAGAGFRYVLGRSPVTPSQCGSWRDFLHAPFAVDPKEVRACVQSAVQAA